MPASDGAGTAFAAVVLAAGASSRFGPGPPKALVTVAGETLVHRVQRVCAGSGADPIVVVAGPSPEGLARALAGGPARVVPNPGWSRGRTGSVQVGVRAIEMSPATLVWPVDTPFAAPATVRALLRSARSDPGRLWWTPTYGGRGGHPVLLTSAAYRPLLAMDPDQPLRSAPFRSPGSEGRVAVDDPGVLDNVDTPVALRAAEARWRARGSP